MWSDFSGYSNIEFFGNGNYKSFVPALNTQWLVFGKMVTLAPGKIVRFHENGALKECVLEEAITIPIYGVLTKIKAGTILEFYDDGSVSKFTLDDQKRSYFWKDNWVYQGRVFEPGTRLELSKNGNILGEP